MTPLYTIRLSVILEVTFWFYLIDAVPRSSRCLQPPTIEGCDTLLLQWSFIPSANQCEQDLACYQQTNSFSSKEECEITCPRVSAPTPPIRILGCRYWLLHMSLCKKSWASSRRDFFGKTHDLMVFTGCGYWKSRVYVYDLRSKKCRVKPWWWRLPPEKKPLFGDSISPVIVPVVTTFESLGEPTVPFMTTGRDY
ncbi:uncharacterized protein LOC142564818 isoform X2 [Dermacentor variabilis]|uniref:uncharacterized protein LOC142564818 isoform X2 n=1 Tax=Dermacentor variabilis TaxID=34621 RepID=UPI003F5BAFF8